MADRFMLVATSTLVGLLILAGCAELELVRRSESSTAPSARAMELGEPCSYGIDFDYEPNVAFDELAWISGQIVVGTVTEVLGPEWGEPRVVRRSGDCLEIMNDYIIEVDERFHGDPVDELRLRAPGGEIGAYEQAVDVAPNLEEGDRYLFFLFRAPESELLPDAWGFDHQRAKPVTPSGEVYGGRAGEDWRELETAEIEQIVTDALSADPPDDAICCSLWGWTDGAIDRDVP